MRDRTFESLKRLSREEARSVVYFKNKSRFQKTFREVAADIAAIGGKLCKLVEGISEPRIAIIGPTSYDWMVIDLACIQNGLFSIAPPEHLDPATLFQILEEANPSLICLDFSMKEKLGDAPWPVHYFNAPEGHSSLEAVEAAPIPIGEENKLLVNYSLAYSSGTSSVPKPIPLKFRKRRPSPFETAKGFRKLILVLKYRTSFWSRSDNKILLFMPFSHLQQRNFVLMALNQGINIILSSPGQAIQHFILEKPNVMVSVPVIYEAVSRRIEKQLSKFSGGQKFLHSIYLGLGINRLSHRHFLQKSFAFFLFKKIKPLYGGNPDYFVTGSAAISRSALETYYKVGVKILEAYGQSESQVISMSSPRNFRIGSVGKPLGKVKIAEDSEIWVKYEPDFHEGPPLKVNEEGYIETGDLGYFDKDGFLFLIGRKDDTIVLPNGKKVFPGRVEGELRTPLGSHQVFVFSRESGKLAAVVVGNNPDAVREVIHAYNSRISDFEKVRELLVTKEAFTVENGLLTGNFKLKRNSLKEKFSSMNFEQVLS